MPLSPPAFKPTEGTCCVIVNSYVWETKRVVWEEKERAVKRPVHVTHLFNRGKVQKNPEPRSGFVSGEGKAFCITSKFVAFLQWNLVIGFSNMYPFYCFVFFLALVVQPLKLSLPHFWTWWLPTPQSYTAISQQYQNSD